MLLLSLLLAGLLAGAFPPVSLPAISLPPMSLPGVAEPEEISSSELDHVLVVTLAHFQMDSQPLVPLTHGALPLSALPAVDAAAKVGRAPDGSCGSGSSLLLVADQRVPSLTLSTFEDKARQNCFSRIWRLVEVADPVALPSSAVPKLGETLLVSPFAALGPPKLGG